MIFYWNTRVNFRSSDENTEFFNIVAGVLQGDILAPYLFIICLDWLYLSKFEILKEICFTHKISRKENYIGMVLMYLIISEYLNIFLGVDM